MHYSVVARPSSILEKLMLVFLLWTLHYRARFRHNIRILYKKSSWEKTSKWHVSFAVFQISNTKYNLTLENSTSIPARFCIFEFLLLNFPHIKPVLSAFMIVSIVAGMHFNRGVYIGINLVKEVETRWELLAMYSMIGKEDKPAVILEL